jgi:hypothetical protein
MDVREITIEDVAANLTTLSHWLMLPENNKPLKDAAGNVLIANPNISGQLLLLFFGTQRA